MTYELIKGVLLPAVSVAVPLWGVYRYFLEGLHRPRIEFSVEVNFYPPLKKDDDFPAEIRIIAHNKGKIQFSFREINLRVRGLKRGEQLSYWRENRLCFPVYLVGEGNAAENIIPSRYGYYFVESGVRQVFTYITKVPQETGLINVFVAFKYRNRKVYIKKKLSFGEKRAVLQQSPVKSFPIIGKKLYRVVVLKRIWQKRRRHEQHTCEKVFEVPETGAAHSSEKSKTTA